MPEEYIEVCPTEEIPDGERAVFGILNRWVAIFNVGGQYYAIEDMCTHDGNILTEDRDGNPIPLQDETVIQCPRHGACFDITTGKFLSGPAGTVDVPFFGVRVQDNMIEVTLKPLNK
ncbi:Rieske 2Fe-2S domain-containing protein [Phototrophicus methaneseepsis]|uniref:Rieske 2Fe-2S domain-containing protein n=1 Tax=Phototrophicus methaneseepsis TaxID=2710758 RepID=A0A7S8E661_9CHLR|nr:Rieske 2Fe-2S domain-containing protein [Phototrophicus methaneseepsis]QPC81096.1 Rieske 2Fe-2S domain-containing protein [Phototrophicus methaneseepsis]